MNTSTFKFSVITMLFLISDFQTLIFAQSSSGTVETKYSGTRSISGEAYSSGYRLRETRDGVVIHTRNLQNDDNYGAAIEFTDNNNNWTAAEHDNANQDQVALDVHWALEMVVDYWKSVHGRNSYDDNGSAVFSYGHSENSNRAYWDPDNEVMVFGDGVKYSTPVTLDVVAHEFGHGVNQFTSQLNTYGESGALNEGLSDIWGAVIEYWAAPEKNHWIIWEEILSITHGFPRRSLKNPSSLNYTIEPAGQAPIIKTVSRYVQSRGILYWKFGRFYSCE